MCSSLGRTPRSCRRSRHPSRHCHCRRRIRSPAASRPGRQACHRPQSVAVPRASSGASAEPARAGPARPPGSPANPPRRRRARRTRPAATRGLVQPPIAPLFGSERSDRVISTSAHVQHTAATTSHEPSRSSTRNPAEYAHRMAEHANDTRPARRLLHWYPCRTTRATRICGRRKRNVVATLTICDTSINDAVTRIAAARPATWLRIRRRPPVALLTAAPSATAASTTAISATPYPSGSNNITNGAALAAANSPPCTCRQRAVRLRSNDVDRALPPRQPRRSGRRLEGCTPTHRVCTIGDRLGLTVADAHRHPSMSSQPVLERARTRAASPSGSSVPDVAQTIHSSSTLRSR